MSNLTALIAPAEVTESPFMADPADLWQWIVYAVQGLFIFGTNIIVLLAFLKHSAFHDQKEFIFVAGLAFADAMNGLAFLSAGLTRTYLVLTEQLNDRVAAWDCLATVHNFIWLWSDQAVTVSLLVISIDRLMSVVLLMKYIHWGPLYAYSCVSVVYVYTAVVGAIGLYISFQEPPDRLYPRICYSEYVALKSPFFTQAYLASTVILFVSVGVYFALMLIGRRYYSKALASLDASKATLATQVKRQRKMTISLAISNTLTFFLCVVPYGLNTLVVTYFYENRLLNNLTIVLWMITNLNPMKNIIIYMSRHREMRRGVRALFTNKTLPPNITNWNQTSAAATPRQHSTTTAAAAGAHKH